MLENANGGEQGKLPIKDVWINSIRNTEKEVDPNKVRTLLYPEQRTAKLIGKRTADIRNTIQTTANFLDQHYEELAHLSRYFVKENDTPASLHNGITSLMFFYGRDLEAAQAHENEAVAYLETLPQFDKAFIGDRKRNYADLLRLKGEFNHDVSEATGLNPSDVEAVKWDTYYFLHDDSQTNGEGNQLNLLHGFDQIYGNQG